MWETQLLVLGLVGWLQPVHGYDVQRELLSWGVTEWASVKRGSIYHALKRLTADGHLEVASTEQVSNRPARTTYRTTRSGDVHFQALLREQLWDTGLTFSQFMIPWSFITVVSHREAAAALRNRAQSLRHCNTEHVESLAQRSTDPTDPMFLPEHVMLASRLQAEQRETEARWCLDVAALVESGDVYTETGPYDLREVADRWKAHIHRLDADGRLPSSP